MIDELKRIEVEMQECIDNVGYKGEAHKAADLLMCEIVKALSERCYDDERACVERIRTAYAGAVKDRWYHA